MDEWMNGWMDECVLCASTRGAVCGCLFAHRPLLGFNSLLGCPESCPTVSPAALLFDALSIHARCFFAYLFGLVLWFYCSVLPNFFLYIYLVYLKLFLWNIWFWVLRWRHHTILICYSVSDLLWYFFSHYDHPPVCGSDPRVESIERGSERNVYINLTK